MVETIERMLNDVKRGRMSRREFTISLGAQPKPMGFPAISLNHITIMVPDLHRTSKFYQDFFAMPLRQQSPTTHILGVGKSFFGIEQGDNQLASVKHFDFGIEKFSADAIRAKLTELNLKFSGTSQESFKFTDPDGFLVQVNGPNYVGQASSLACGPASGFLPAQHVTSAMPAS